MSVMYERIRTALAESNDECALFYERIVGFFHEKCASETSRSRKPSWAIRLVLPGQPYARMVIKADWLRRQKQIDTSTLSVEVLLDVGDNPLAYDFSTALKVRILADGVKLYSCQTDEQGWQCCQRLLATVRQFIDDPAEVFRQSSDFCCSCGKALTDEKSRARGIGPDCLWHSEWFRNALAMPVLAKA